MGSLSGLRRRVAAGLDALSRWALLPGSAPGRARRFVIVQIDGLSHEALQQALNQGHMRGMGRLLRLGELALSRVPVGLPTSTPAFQAALMYGGPVDIPAFEFLDKRTHEYVWFPRPWASARVEAAHAEGRRGIMAGGRTYGCVFGGGAADSVLTFAHLLRPSPLWGRFGVRARLVPLLVLGWAGVKMLVVTVLTLLRWGGLALRDFALGRAIPSLRRMVVRLVISGWLRELFTHGVAADIYAGVPALYVNFVDYDVPAHERGPDHPQALRALRAVDASIRRIRRVLRRVPEFRYDLFILSDHGQTRSMPFAALGEPAPVAERILDLFRRVGRGGAEAPPPAAVREAALAGASARWPLGRVWQQNLSYLEPWSRERHTLWAGELCIVPAGPNVNIYLTREPGHVRVEAIEAGYPGIMVALSRAPGVGFALARDAAGSVCYHQGVALRIPPPAGPTGCPLFDRPDRELVVEGLENLLAMPCAGDIVLYGNYTSRGCVNYLNEQGSHGGPSVDELYGFIAAPPHVRFDFATVRGPRDLYPLFAAYHDRSVSASRPT